MKGFVDQQLFGQNDIADAPYDWELVGRATTSNMSTSSFMIVVYLCFSGSFTVFQVLLSYEKDGSKAYDEWLSWQSLGLVVFKASV